MDNREDNSVATDAAMSVEIVTINTFPIIKDSQVDTKFNENSKRHVSEDYNVENEQNDDFNFHEIHSVSEEPDHLDGTSNVILPELDYNEVDTKEYYCVTRFTYEPSYEVIKRKSSLAESDDSNDDDPEKKRVKCLQYIGLLIAGVILSIIVIYYGRVDTEGFIDFDELRRLRNYT